MSFSLLILKGPGAGETIELDQDEITFGRVDDNDVVLYDPDVSRKHFCIVAEGGSCVLEDLGSSNGTRVNGQLVESWDLSPGDEIQVGRAVFEFREDSGDTGVVARGRSSSAKAERGAAGMSARERFRAREAASTPIGRLKLWYDALAPRSRLILHVGGGVLGLVALLVTWVLAQGEDGVLGPQDHSGSVVRYERRMADWRFGHGVDELSHHARDDFGFSFNYLDGRVTITFDAGFIEGDNEVEIRLNDERLIGYAPLAIGTWIRDNYIVLHHDALEPHSMNEIVFDQNRNPGASPPATWAIENVRIVEDAIPEPDPIRADERFELAERRWRNREISPRNLYSACRHFQEARDYLERLDDKPPLYDEVAARVRECTDQLERVYRRMVFEAQRHEQFRDMEAARATLYQLLEYFPEETDPRHRTVREWLRTYN